MLNGNHTKVPYRANRAQWEDMTTAVQHNTRREKKVKKNEYCTSVTLTQDVQDRS